MPAPIRTAIDLVSVWKAVRSQLETELELNDDTCFFWSRGGDNSGDQPPPTPADVFLTLAPDGGSFDQALFDGGDIFQKKVDTGIAVTIYTQIFLGADDRDDEFFLNTLKGVGPLFSQVVDALSGFDPTFGNDANTALRERMRPSGFTKPMRSHEDRYGKMTIMFELSFDVA